MITIISGKDHNKKMKELLNQYQESKGDGFLLEKVMDEGNIMCYDMLELSTGNHYRLAYHEKYMPVDWSHTLILGAFYFDENVFNFITEKVQQYVREEVTPIYLDEIGFLELMDKGFSDILHALIDYKIDCIIGIKHGLIKNVVKKFQIETYDILVADRKEKGENIEQIKNRVKKRLKSRLKGKKKKSTGKFIP